VTLLVLLAALSPTLLFGESLGPLGLVFLAAVLLGGGLVLRRVGGADVRSIGTLLAVVGVVLLIISVGLLVLVLGGLGRPY
jgi:hypothetical protein